MMTLAEGQGFVTTGGDWRREGSVRIACQRSRAAALVGFRGLAFTVDSGACILLNGLGCARSRIACVGRSKAQARQRVEGGAARIGLQRVKAFVIEVEDDGHCAM